MTRREAREQAFMLVFEKSFSDLPISEIIEQASAGRDLEVDDFSYSLTCAVVNRFDELDAVIAENLKNCAVVNRFDELDAVIAENLKNWKIERLSRVVRSILRISVYELLYLDDVPLSVSINEAVELAKKFATQEDAGFINGVLGAVADKIQAK